MVLSPPSNQNSSCYLDSLLIALLHDKTNTFTKLSLTPNIPPTHQSNRLALIRVQGLMGTISQRLRRPRSTPMVNVLRNSLRTQLQVLRPTGSTSDFTCGPLDVSEAWEILDNVFKPPDTVRYEIVSFVTHDTTKPCEVDDGADHTFTHTGTETSTHPNVIMLDARVAGSRGDADHKVTEINLCKQISDNVFDDTSGVTHHQTRYPRSIKVRRLVAAPYLVVMISRFDCAYNTANPRDTSKIKHITRLPWTVQPLQLEHPPLHLVSLVVHLGSVLHDGHYITYFQQKHVWYRYTNTRTPYVTKIGDTTTLENLCAAEIWSNVTHAFYC